MYAPPWLEAGQTKLEDPGAGIVSAFAKGAEINARRQALEEAMRQHDATMKHYESQEGIRLLELRNQMAQHAVDNYYKEQNLQVDQGALGLRAKEYRDKINDKHTAMDQYGNISQGASDLDVNDPEAYQKYLQLEADNPFGADTHAGVVAHRTFVNRYNTNANKQITALNAELKPWQSNVAKDWGPGWENLMDDSMWQTQVKMPKGFKDYKGNPLPYAGSDTDVWDPKSGKIVKAGTLGTATGNLFAATDNPKFPFLTERKSVVQDRINRYQGFRDRISKLPQQQTVPGMGVYPQTPVNETVNAVPLPSDQSQLQTDTPYSAKGKTWRYTGSGFVPWQ